MPRQKTDEERRKKGWRELNHLAVIETVVQNIRLGDFLTKEGVQKKIAEIEGDYLKRVTEEFTDIEQDREWIAGVLWDSVRFSHRRYRVYRIDWIRESLKKMGIIERISDLEKVVLMINADNRVDYEARLEENRKPYGPKAIPMDHEDIDWMIGRIEGYFKTDQYRKYLKE